jgi:hypothetical protein
MAIVKQEPTTEPRHLVEDTEARFGGNAFQHEQKKVKRMHQQGHDHKMFHEHVKTMCGGGKVRK